MNVDWSESVKREARLDEVIAKYLDDVDAGQAPNRELFLADNRDLADDLAEFLDNRKQFQRVVVPMMKVANSVTITCPQCQNLIETGASVATCGSCGWQLNPYPSADPFPTPHRVGRIELTAVIGRGAFGTVYRGWDLDMYRDVAVKVLRNDPLARPDQLPRFLRDSKIAAQLDHPGIVKVHDVGESQGIPYLISEFVPGLTLASLIRDTPPVPDQAASLVMAVADALEHAHQKGVIHRDVKPANILLKSDREPMLTDFGLALWDTGEATLTEDGKILGTLAYMSPEQARGQGHRADGRSDVYSLGVVLYELLTGERPFAGNVKGILHQIEYDEPRPPSVLDDRVPRDLETICLKCLRKEPAQRYASAKQLADDLRLYLDRKPILARPVGHLERAVRWGRRNPTQAIAIGLAAVFLVATTVVSVAWAIHANHQADAIEKALNESKRVTAVSEFDRGMAEADRGDVGVGLLWMARSLETHVSEPGNDDFKWTVRVNLNAWSQQLFTLVDCIEPPPGRILAFSPDGRLAWFVQKGGQTVRCWELASAQIVGPTLQHDAVVESIAVNPDGTRVACGGKRLGVRIWNTTTGKLEPAPEGVFSVRGMIFSNDGKTLIFCTGTSDGTTGTVLKTWDGSRLQALGKVHDSSGTIAIAAESNGQTLLVAGNGDKEIRRWDMGNGQLRERLLHHPGLVNSISVSPDSRIVLTSGDAPSARVWDIDSGQLLALLPHRTPVSAVGIARDGKTLQTAGEGDAIRVWANSRESESGSSRLHPSKIRTLAMSPGGNLVATGANDGQVRIWSIATGKLEQVGNSLQHSSPIQAVAFSPTGLQLATSTHLNKGVQLWDVTTQKRGPILAHPDRVHQISFSPDGRLAATAAFDNNVWVWDTQTGQPLWQKPLAHGQMVWAVLFDPTGKTIITAGADRQIHRWDVATGTSVGTPQSHGDAVRAIAFHPLDPRNLMAAGEDGILKFWDVDKGELLGQLSHGDSIALAKFAPDGRTVLTGGVDGAVRVWEVATCREIERTLRHEGKIRGIAISQNGKFAATASEDGTSRIWATRTGWPIGRRVRHDPFAMCAAIDPTDRWVLTAGMDRTLRLLKAPTELVGTPSHITQWVQVATGAELDVRGDLHPLDPLSWRQRQANLQTLGAFP